MDNTSSFFNHMLDEELSKLTTFGTPFGHYMYLRMPMGASLSSEIYQYKVDSHLEGIENCMAIADDIIIYGFKEDGSNHDMAVRKVLDKVKLVGMRFNPTKCQFRKKQVKFFGLVLTRDGVISDPAKIDVLRKSEKCQSPEMRNFYKAFWGQLIICSDLTPT